MESYHREKLTACEADLMNSWECIHGVHTHSHVETCVLDYGLLCTTFRDSTIIIVIMMSHCLYCVMYHVHVGQVLIDYYVINSIRPGSDKYHLVREHEANHQCTYNRLVVGHFIMFLHIITACKFNGHSSQKAIHAG